MPNKSEWNNLIPIVILVAAPWAARYGISDVMIQNLCLGLGALFTASWAIYSAWNMRRVHETAIVIGHAPDVKTAVAESVPAPTEAVGGRPSGANRGGLICLAILMGLFAMLLMSSNVWATDLHVTGNTSLITPGMISAVQPVPCTDLLHLVPPGCQGIAVSASGAATGPLANIVNFFAGQFDSALALAVQFPELQDGNGAACWKRASTLGAIIKVHPLILTGNAPVDLEAQRLFFAGLNGMCADPHCTQVFTDLGNGVQALGANISIPNFTSFCTRFPTITMVAPDPSLLPATAAPVSP